MAGADQGRNQSEKIDFGANTHFTSELDTITCPGGLGRIFGSNKQLGQATCRLGDLR